jgi:hypothetical protein
MLTHSLTQKKTFWTPKKIKNQKNLKAWFCFFINNQVLPLECGPGGVNVSFDCSNKENVASDLVISKLVIEVDSRFGEYG